MSGPAQGLYLLQRYKTLDPIRKFNGHQWKATIDDTKHIYAHTREDDQSVLQGEK